jgi:hypothetical protein
LPLFYDDSFYVFLRRRFYVFTRIPKLPLFGYRLSPVIRRNLIAGDHGHMRQIPGAARRPTCLSEPALGTPDRKQTYEN